MPESTTPPQTPPPIITQSRASSGGRQWRSLILLLAVALAVAGLVVLGGRWVYNSVRDEPTQETTITSDRPTKQPATTSNPPASPPSSPATPPSTQRPSTQNRTGQIANTGPGSVTAIFFGTAAGAAALHYVVSLRRS